MPIANLQTRIFADGADLENILSLAEDARVEGFTTNPTLMRQAGIDDYGRFAKELLSRISDRPISFEVFADDREEIRRQAFVISSWAENVYVKIPVTTTRGESLADIVRELSESAVKINVTAVFTLEQVAKMTESIKNGAPSYLSIFAGRIADTGVDPVPLVAAAVETMKQAPLAECIWASPRELLNLFHANDAGCHVITMTPDLLKKLDLVGKELSKYSLETVQMFFNDAKAAGYQL